MSKQCCYAGGKNPQLEIDIFSLVLLFACTLFYKFRAASVISIVCFAIYLAVMVRNYPVFFIKYFVVFFSVASVVSSCIISEFWTIYMPELKVYSGFAGSLPLIILSYWVLIKVVILSDGSPSASPNQNPDKISEYILTGLSIVIVTVYLINFMLVFRHPAFLEGLDRFAYKREYGNVGGPVWSKVFALASTASFLPLVCLITQKKIGKKIGAFALLLYLLNALWTGNKFGSFFSVFVIYMILLSHWKYTGLRDFRARKLVLGVCFAFGLLLIGTLAIQSMLSGGKTKNILAGYFIIRWSQQGQLWWRIFDKFEGVPHLDEFGSEVSENLRGEWSIDGNLRSKFGIYRMMYLASTTAYVDSRLGVRIGASRFTEAGYAAMYYYFGYPGPILYSVVMGWILAKLVNRICQDIEKRLFINALIHLKFLEAFRTAWSMFTFSAFISPVFVLGYIYLIMSSMKFSKRDENVCAES